MPRQAEDQAEFGKDEVRAIVKRDLQEQEIDGRRILSVSDFTGSYIEQGKWSGTCKVTCETPLEPPTRSPQTKMETFEEELRRIMTLGDSGDSRSMQRNIRWNFYEKSQTVEIVLH